MRADDNVVVFHILFCVLNLVPIAIPSLDKNGGSEITTTLFSIALVNIGFECVPVGWLDYD